MGEPPGPLGGGLPDPRDRLRAPDAGPLPGTPAVAGRGLLAPALAAIAPALAAGAASFHGGAGPAGLFAADATGLAALLLVAPHAPPDIRRGPATLLAAPLALALAHAGLAGAHGGPSGGTAALLALGVAISLGAAGLGALGRRLGCPAPASAVVASAVLGLACGGVWWADRLAERVPAERRSEVRQAVLHADPMLATAYGASGYDRLRSTSVYEGTTVASSAVSPPDATNTATVWGVAGLLFLGIAHVPVGRRRPRVAPGTP